MAPPKPIKKRTVSVRLADLELLPLNARYMKHEVFQNLVSNIKRDGGLMGNTPFAAKLKKGKTLCEDGTELPFKYMVLSGNHRVKAAIEAGLEYEEITLTDDNLPKQRQLAVQLSQNAIVGEDDPAVLKQLYDEIDDVDWRMYSGLDDKALELLDKVEVGSISEANLDFQTVTIVFLPHELDDVEDAWEAAREEIGSKPDVAWLASRADYDKFLDALDAGGKSFDISNVATSLLLVLKIFERHLGDLSEGFLDDEGEVREGRQRWVPLSALLGTYDIPPGAAMTIQRAIAKIQDQDDAGDNLWQALEFICADFLAGVVEDAG